MKSSNQRISKLSDFIVISNDQTNVFQVKRIIDKDYYKMHKISFANKSLQYQQNAIDLVYILSYIQNPHIIQYKDSFYDYGTHSLYIITEFLCNSSPLSEIVNKNKSHKAFFNEKDIISIMTSVALVMNTFHQMNLSMSFLSSDIIYLTSQFETKVDISEGIFNLHHNYKADNAKDNEITDDIWKLGTLIYYICTFNPDPFNNDKEKKIKGLYQPIPYGYSDSLGELIKLCLQYQHYRRPTIKQIISFIHISFKHSSTINNYGNKEDNKKNRNAFALSLYKNQARNLKLNPLWFNQTIFNPKRNHNDMKVINNTRANQSKLNQSIQPHYRQGKLNCKHNHELRHNKSYSVIDKIKNRNKAINIDKRREIKQSKSINKRYHHTTKINHLDIDNDKQSKSFELNSMVRLNNIQSLNMINRVITNSSSNKLIPEYRKTNEHDYYLYPALNSKYPQKRLFTPINNSFQTYNIVNYNLSKPKASNHSKQKTN